MDDRINKIYKNEKFQYSINKIAELERSRRFCRHGIEHSLDVARIAYILSLEEGLRLKKDVIYAAALLHDIGRWMQYQQGVPHEKASSNLAYDILVEADFSNDEIASIKNAITSHRNSNEDTNLCSILYKSDKLSRNCFCCSSSEECNWSYSKKNRDVTY